MGPNGDPTQGYAVTEGPFRRGAWRLWARDDGGVSPFVPGVDQPVEDRFVVRAMGTADGAALPTAQGVDWILDRPAYDEAPYDGDSGFVGSFRQSLEAGVSPVDSHNSVHVYVGGLFDWQDEEQSGTMALGTSPNDPVFWLHHNNIDRLWDVWSAQHGRVYLPESGAPDGVNRDDTMEPFESIGVLRTPGDLLSTDDLGYRFAGRPSAQAPKATNDPGDGDLHTLAATNGLLCVL
jgi:tyrosinase